MSVSKVIKDYISDFYVIELNKGRRGALTVIFMDIEEDRGSPETYEIGTIMGKKVIVVWGKILNITGIQYLHKDYRQDITKFFSNLINDKTTKDYIKFLIEQKYPVRFTLKEMIEYFPLLEN